MDTQRTFIQHGIRYSWIIVLLCAYTLSAQNWAPGVMLKSNFDTLVYKSYLDVDTLNLRNTMLQRLLDSTTVGGVDTTKYVSMNRMDSIIYGKKLFSELQSLKLWVTRSPSQNMGTTRSFLLLYDTVATGSRKDTVVMFRPNYNTTGYILRASGITSFPTQSATRAYTGYNQVISGGIDAKVLFSNKNYDNQSEFNTTYSTFTVTEEGGYIITSTVEITLSSVPADLPMLQLRKNGNIVTYGALGPYSYTGFVGYTRLTITDMQLLKPGDCIEIWISSSSGVTIVPGTEVSYVTIAKIF